MRRLLPAALALALAALAAPAGAIDLTGTWSDTKHTTCAGLTSAGEKIALKSSQYSFFNLPITQTGTTIHANIMGYLWFFEGQVYEELDPDKGQGVMQKCPGGLPDSRITMRITKAQTFPTNSKGVSGKMTTIYILGSPTENYSCTITWERVSTTDPGSAACP